MSGTAGRGLRPRAVVVALAILSIATVPSTAAGTVRAPTRPNIVFVLTDDLAANLVTPRLMPHLWKLEQQGTIFNDYFVTDSLCCPSRASIFTGRYPHDTGVFDNAGIDGGYRAFQAHHDEASTVATDLAGVGYRTAMMGKYLNRYHPHDPPAPGWSTWDVVDWGYPEFNYAMNENGRVVHYGGPKQKGRDNYLTDVLSRLAGSFITTTVRTHPSDPFFLEVATFAPHSPYTPAPKYAHLYPNLRYPVTPAFDASSRNPPDWLGYRAPLTERALDAIRTGYRKRAQSVRSIDDLIGSLMRTLRMTGRLANTYFVFSSDNGLHMGEHRLLPGKLTAFDTDIRVPLLVVGPGVPANQAVNAMAENIDLRPTFDAMAGTTPGEGIDGRSLLPLVNPVSIPKEWREGVLIEHHGPKTADAGPDKPRPGSGNPPTYEALRFTDALYVEYATGEHEYYDLRSDPYELDNVYSELAPSLKQTLHEDLSRLENCHDDPRCSYVVAPPSP